MQNQLENLKISIIIFLETVIFLVNVCLAQEIEPWKLLKAVDENLWSNTKIISQ